MRFAAPALLLLLLLLLCAAAGAVVHSQSVLPTCSNALVASLAPTALAPGSDTLAPVSCVAAVREHALRQRVPAAAHQIDIAATPLPLTAATTTGGGGGTTGGGAAAGTTAAAATTATTATASTGGATTGASSTTGGATGGTTGGGVAATTGGVVAATTGVVAGGPAPSCTLSGANATVEVWVATACGVATLAPAAAAAATPSSFSPSSAFVAAPDWDASAAAAALASWGWTRVQVDALGSGLLWLDEPPANARDLSEPVPMTCAEAWELAYPTAASSSNSSNATVPAEPDLTWFSAGTEVAVTWHLRVRVLPEAGVSGSCQVSADVRGADACLLQGDSVTREDQIAAAGDSLGEAGSGDGGASLLPVDTGLACSCDAGWSGARCEIATPLYAEPAWQGAAVAPASFGGSSGSVVLAPAGPPSEDYADAAALSGSQPAGVAQAHFGAVAAAGDGHGLFAVRMEVRRQAVSGTALVVAANASVSVGVNDTQFSVEEAAQFDAFCGDVTTMRAYLSYACPFDTASTTQPGDVAGPACLPRMPYADLRSASNGTATWFRGTRRIAMFTDPVLAREAAIERTGNGANNLVVLSEAEAVAARAAADPDGVLAAFTLDQFSREPDLTQCGCGANVQRAEFFVEIEHDAIPNATLRQRAATVGAQCTYQVSRTAAYACPLGSPVLADQAEGDIEAPRYDGVAAACSGRGICGQSLCECLANLTRFDCTGGAATSEEAFNGIILPKIFKPHGNAAQKYFVERQYSNEKLTIDLKAFAVTPENALDLLDEDPLSESKSLVLANTNIAFFISFGKEPPVRAVRTTLDYPLVNISTEITDPDETVLTFFAQDAPFSIDLTEHRDLDDFEPIIHITIIPLGAFDMTTSLPEGTTEDDNVQIFVALQFEDEIMSLIDIVLLCFFVFIILFCCLTWKVCPTCFHGCMKLALPELYLMKIQQDKDKQQKDRINKEAARQLEAGDVRSVLKHVSASLAGARVPRVQVPKGRFNVVDALTLAVRSLDPSLGKVRVKVEQIDGLEGFVHPFDLLNAVLTMLRTMPRPPAIQVTGPRVNVSDILDQLQVDLPDVQLDLAVTFPIIGFPQFLAFMDEFVSVPGFTNFITPILDLDPAEFPAIVYPPLPLDRLPKIDKVIQMLLAAIPRYELPLGPQFSESLRGFLDDLDMRKPKGLFLGDVTLDLSQAVQVEMPTVNIDWRKVSLPEDLPLPTKPKLALALFQHLFFALVGSFLISIIEAFTVLFNIVLLHKMFIDLDWVALPPLEELKAALAELFGPLITVIDGLEVWLDFMNFRFLVNLVQGFNCGGLLTLLTPFVFFFGAMFLWVVLQKDVVLWLGVRLRLFDTRGKFKVAKKKALLGLSRLFTRAALLSLQGVIFVFGQTVLTTQTLRTCSDVDLVANTLGKVVVGVFYVFFYILISFIFTGAPDLAKYDGMGFLRKWVMLSFDGTQRFLLLSSGVWTDATIRSYNIIPRARRYLEKSKHQTAPHPLNPNVQGTAEANPEEKDSLHEQVMLLIAASRGVVWIPLPIGAFITKFSEALNQAHVFLFLYEESVQLRRPFYSRLITWVSQFAQFPLILGFIFTAVEWVGGAIFLTMLPTFLIRLPDEISPAVDAFKAGFVELRQVKDLQNVLDTFPTDLDISSLTREEALRVARTLRQAIRKERTHMRVSHMTEHGDCESEEDADEVLDRSIESDELDHETLHKALHDANVHTSEYRPRHGDH